MTIWIITMGNRDVQLQRNDNWESLYEEVRYDEPIESCDEFWCPDEFEDKETKRFLIPARVLGLVYGRHPDNYQDLAIQHELETKTVNLQVNGVDKRLSAPELIVWNDAGLGFVRNPQDKQYRDNELKRRLQVDLKQPVFDEKLEILKQLNFPVDNKDIKSVFWFYDKKKKKDCFQFHKIGSNTGMYHWLYKLRPDFQPWKLLTWIAQYKRERDADLRNQLMHNLLGVEPQEVIRYLLGNQRDSRYTDVISTYQQEVKTPFIREVKRLNLPFKERGLPEELQHIVESMH